MPFNDYFINWGTLPIVVMIRKLIFSCSDFHSGAKQDHVASPHFAQMMYFGLISAAATAPLHFSSTQFTYLLEPFWNKRMAGILQWLAALVAGFVSVHWFRSDSNTLLIPVLLPQKKKAKFDL